MGPLTHPLYIAFEGIDGSGKTTQAMLLGRAAEQRGITAIHLSEPSCGPYGLEIRRRLVTNELGTLADQRELFTRDRRDHVVRKIVPLLDFVARQPGFIVVQSRSFLSAAAYQSDTEEPALLEAIVAEQRTFAPMPDRIVILDVPVDVVLARISEAGRGDAFETRDNLTRVRQRYWHLAKSDSQHVIWIDGCGGPALVAERVAAAIFGSQ